MARWAGIILVALLGACVVGLSSPASAQAVVGYSTEEIAFVELLNDYRVSKGAGTLQVSDLLSLACDRHNSDMAKYRYFDHYTRGSDWFPYGSSPFYRMSACGYGFNAVKGENIAAGYDSAQEVFTAWKNSSGHNSNMLNPDFKVLGVSLVYDLGSQYGSYWTIDLGGYVDQTAHPLPLPEPTIPCTYLRGSDRYDTALKISQEMFAGALPAGSGLVLAPGDTFAEALCGAPLAAAYGGPVLLSLDTILTSGISAEILRLDPDRVFVIGLPTAIKTAVEGALGPNATVTAINGSDVYDMSRRVAAQLAARVGGLQGGTAILTRGDVFPDAIGVSPLACTQGWPIVLTGPGDNLHPSASATMSDLGITRAIKVGTYAELPEGVVGIANLSGTDRYVTNRNVAEWSLAAGALSTAHLGLATGDKFPDALAAGPYLALDRGILLLTPLYGPLPAGIADFIAASRDRVQHFSFIAMIEPVLSQTKSLLP